ncbi:Serine proteinase inhibitor IA-2 [Hypsizygus marmoreus]|uniref:Serine proteinase inhibitor IA-2 n=1 Tax=Hypsizygus marmoreus TaxID=39966 RepID=A0A369J3Y5_HYPMA|nr:Serine proteinase inhibitor IA-2 [Hypsizygus marmoreus]
MRIWRQIRRIATDSSPSPPRAPTKSQKAMSGKYIVVFKDSATTEQIDQYVEKVNSNGGEVANRYDAVLKGFAATIPDHFLASLQGDDIIDYIEPDSIVTTQ